MQLVFAAYLCVHCFHVKVCLVIQLYILFYCFLVNSQKYLATGYLDKCRATSKSWLVARLATKYSTGNISPEYLDVEFLSGVDKLAL